MNQREIKFRAWDNVKEEMSFDNEFALSQISHPDGFTIMQFTGLKDSKGVEIYEGDILGYKKNPTVSSNYYHIPVVFKDGMFCLYDKYNVWGYVIKRVDLYEFLKDRIKKLIVIGNIFENKELLGEKR